MKIIVLNGSPKGQLSVTMQYINFIQKRFPMHDFKIIDISLHIKNIEKNEKEFHGIIDDVRSSDCIIWAFPVYFCLVPSQYKRFIELVMEKGAKDAFKDKYTAVLSTSVHFFDHTAHNYMHAICDDLDMRYIGFFSAEMEDLLKKKEQDRLMLFASGVFEIAEQKAPVARLFEPIIHRMTDYKPGEVKSRIDTAGKKIVVVTDADGTGTNLEKMVDRFKNSFSENVEVCNLRDIDIKGGCLGCIHCSLDNICVYKDGFADFYNTRLKAADIIVFAGTVRDRYLSSLWKMFFDRSFFNGHVPTLIGKQMGFIISGPFRQLPDLRQVFETYTEIQWSNLAGFVTDEYEGSAYIDSLLDNLAFRLLRLSEMNYKKPETFLGIAGRKIFRDDIWGKLRFIFQADHRFYKRYGLYDFPQYDIGARVMNLFMMLITKIPTYKKHFQKKMRENMIRQYKKI